MTTTTEGFTVASAAPGLRSRAAQLRWWWVPIGLLAVLIGAITLVKPTEDFDPLSIKNFQPEGSRALAEVATSQGLTIRQIDTLRDARIVDPAHTTVIIADGAFIYGAQVESILDYPGDVVVLNPSYEMLEQVAPSLSSTVVYPYSADAGCTDPDAVAAGTISSQGRVFVGSLPRDTVGCFPAETDQNTMIVIPNDGHSLTLIADPGLVTNAFIADDGNAALALRLVGRHDTAVWYLSVGYDTSSLTWLDTSGGGSVPKPSPSLDFFPPGTGNAVFALLISLIAVALWRGRRFGPLVTEPLPVVIRSSEATAGRARLYKVARSYGRASASLRAAAALRMGTRLGIARGPDKEHLVNAISRATGRTTSEIDALLYGPPPSSESAMMELIAHIDTIENEVHRP